jgi:2-succinyl-5-enolpyruvyl-6-hydroxy-3-cyclohexene-1-carboxylate synthase
VKSKKELHAAMSTAKSRVIELVTDRTTNVEVHAALNNAIVTAIDVAMA